MRRSHSMLSISGLRAEDIDPLLGFLSTHDLRAVVFLGSEPLLSGRETWRRLMNSRIDIGSAALHGFADPRGNLTNWPFQAVEDDLRDARTLLEETFPGYTFFPFLLPGPSTWCLDSAEAHRTVSYLPAVLSLFTTALHAEERTGMLVPAGIPVEGLFLSSWQDVQDRSSEVLKMKPHRLISR